MPSKARGPGVGRAGGHRGALYATWTYVSRRCPHSGDHLAGIPPAALARGRAGREGKQTRVVGMERGKVKREKGKEPEKGKIQQKGEEKTKRWRRRKKSRRKKGEGEKIKEKNGKEKTEKGKEEKITERKGEGGEN